MKTNPARMERVQEIFRDVFGSPDLKINDDTSPENIAAWDSLTHINLIVSIEEAFQVQFLSEEVVSLSSVRVLLDLLDKKLSGKGD